MVHGGSGKLELTGSLGEVMKESAKLAITMPKAHAGGIWIWHQNCSKMRIYISMRRRGYPGRRPQCGRYAHYGAYLLPVRQKGAL